MEGVLRDDEMGGITYVAKGSVGAHWGAMKEL